MSTSKNVEVFNRDAVRHGGYLYTAGARLSSRLATQRTACAILAATCFAGRSVLDLGCGDGSYTIQLWDNGSPRSMVGIDAAQHAIEVANRAKQHRPIQFVVGDAHRLPWAANSFDLVLIQSILHHDDRPWATIREAFRLAPEILIHEPNGYNFGLKIIEKTSDYHLQHQERSYRPSQIGRWIEEAGGGVTYRRYAGFVPMFCPAWLARSMKAVEPLIERIPVVNAVGCAVVLLKGSRSG